MAEEHSHVFEAQNIMIKTIRKWLGLNKLEAEIKMTNGRLDQLDKFITWKLSQLVREQKVDDLINWVAHKGGYENAPINVKQYNERVIELEKRL